MSRKFVFAQVSVVALAAVLLPIFGCTKSEPETAAGPKALSQPDFAAGADDAVVDGQDEEHGHEAGAHGGIVVSLGRDSYHVEAIVTDTGELRLYTLGNDETRVIDVEIQDLIAYVKATGESDSVSVALTPQSQPGDAEGKSSLFVAQLPDALVGQNVDVTVPNITIANERFRLGFSTKTEDHAASMMPLKVANDEERELYLTPGGIYTQADIDANGNVTASQKFVGFRPKHDLHPNPGDRICPVTLTKANPACSWIIGGKTYEFCCPPCIDEYVLLAKTQPDQIKDPDYWVKQEATNAAP